MTDSTKDSIWKTSRNRARTFWREHLQQRWQDYQWPAIVGLGLLALGLGCVGFAKHFAAIGEGRSPLDILYLTLQLFKLDSGAVSGPVPWELELARLLAPTVAAGTPVKALAAVFREQIELLRVRFISDHVVVCGLGRKGAQLIKDFRDQGDKVVVVEIDKENDEVRSCRDSGAIVLLVPA